MFWSVPRGDTCREQMESWGPTYCDVTGPEQIGPA